ncbi:MAG TPA: hypothetical protein VD947_00300 [Patescibacteria group bacterium]|nr:hypothetical protein [Patescibacteria group bacterium]
MHNSRTVVARSRARRKGGSVCKSGFRFQNGLSHTKRVNGPDKLPEIGKQDNLTCIDDLAEGSHE